MEDLRAYSTMVIKGSDLLAHDFGIWDKSFIIEPNKKYKIWYKMFDSSDPCDTSFRYYIGKAEELPREYTTLDDKLRQLSDKHTDLMDVIEDLKIKIKEELNGILDSKR